MKHFNVLSKLAIVTCTLGTVSCMKQMSESVVDPKVGSNGSFEMVKEELPVNWLVYTEKTTGEGSFKMDVDTSNAKEGQQALRFHVSACSDLGGHFSPGIAQELDVEPGKDYRIHFWVKNEGTAFKMNTSAVTAFEASQGPVLRSSETFKDWHLFTMDYKIPESMQKLRLELSVLKPGTLWIDAVSLEKLP